ncbi:cell division protein CrgA [Corynebacterium guangdongense]|uniref:Cell division protein CrgA n=1 Tax=Corynebacterium guangdongense TaxID=1783348 RepID=A0ABU2A1Z3_9CORY|nr:cell division protein CrgA [Corynebacterium guangdongense]MDR7330628.1 hypothetical protein [Corynebacterium guangdongense]WJZ16644.1 Cell division protein CrgA [Corynebacterium guangdongense]
MPKAKITSNSTAPLGTTSGVSRTPVKINSGGTPKWYLAIMFLFMIVGLAWLIINYLAGPSIPVMMELGPWNYAIGFGLFLIGLLMTMGWR